MKLHLVTQCGVVHVDTRYGNKLGVFRSKVCPFVRDSYHGSVLL